MAETTLESNSALLVMDVQRGTVERYGNDTALLERINIAITAARTGSIPVIYIHVQFREGYPEVSPRNKSFSATKQSGNTMTKGTSATEIHPAVPSPAATLIWC